MERVYLDVPFGEKDEARAPLPPPQGPPLPAIRLTVLGLPTRCWKCHEPTTAIVGLLPPDGDEYDMLDCSDPDVLAVAAALVDSAATTRHYVGAVKSRYSATVGYEYLSNGCVRCDALLGSYPLREETMEAISDHGIASLSRLAEIEVPTAAVARLLAEHFGETDDDDD